MRVALAWTVLSAAVASGAEPCREEKLVVERPRVIAVKGVDAAREVDFRVHTCEGSEIDRLIEQKQVRVDLVFQDAPEGTIVRLEGGRSITRHGKPPLVLVDAGAPGPKDVIVPTQVRDAVNRIASVHPEWHYAVIRGNERGCELGSYNTNQLAPERLARMAEEFCRTEAPRSLVVVSATTPVWLAREATEWFTDPTRAAIDDEQQRRDMGVREQSRILESGNTGRALERLFESNRVVLVSNGASSDPLSSAVHAAAKESGALVPFDRLRGDHSLCDVRISHAGSVRFDMSALRDHPSGRQPFEVQLVDRRTNDVLLQESQELPDPTRRDWERDLIGCIPVFVGLVFSLAMIVLLMGQFSEDRSPKLMEAVRNGFYALSGTTLAIALAILPSVRTGTHRGAFYAAIIVSGITLLFAACYTYMAGSGTRKAL